MSKSKWPPNCQVGPGDLGRLNALHSLLAALNDPLVSRSKLELLTTSIPVLAARIEVIARQRWPSADSLRLALQRIGNRGLEQVLLEFLEDLTEYKDDFESQRPPPAPTATSSVGQGPGGAAPAADTGLSAADAIVGALRSSLPPALAMDDLAEPRLGDARPEFPVPEPEPKAPLVSRERGPSPAPSPSLAPQRGRRPR